MTINWMSYFSAVEKANCDYLATGVYQVVVGSELLPGSFRVAPLDDNFQMDDYEFKARLCPTCESAELYQKGSIR